MNLDTTIPQPESGYTDPALRAFDFESQAADYAACFIESIEEAQRAREGGYVSFQDVPLLSVLQASETQLVPSGAFEDLLNNAMVFVNANSTPNDWAEAVDAILAYKGEWDEATG